MNLIEVQQSLQGLPDDYLVQQMRQPTGEAPQYLILSELQRRKKMRAAAAQQPTSTVRQDVAGFAEGGSVSKENKPGWMSGGIGSLLGGGLMPMLLPGLNDMADGDGFLGGLGTPWLLRQLGFGNKGEETDPAAATPARTPMSYGSSRPIGTQLGIRGFAGGDEVKSKTYEQMLRQREQDPKKLDRSLNKDSKAMGVYQILPSTWNNTAKQHPEMKFKLVPARPTEADIPSLEEQKRMLPLVQGPFKDALIRKGYNPNPANMYVTHWQGPDAGPKLLDYLSAHPMATAEDAFRYARPDAYGVVMSQNGINPKALLSDVMGQVEKDFGNFSVGEKLGDDGTIVPTRASFDADARRTINAPEDPDYLAWKAEQQASAPQLSSVPKASAWNGILPEQEYQRPLRPNLGEPMNARGITELLQKLTPSRQLPGSKEPQPWQIIQQQGIAQHAQGGRVRGFAGPEGSYVAPPTETLAQKRYREAINRSRAAAGLPPLETGNWGQPFDVSGNSWGAVQDFAEQGPWADNYGFDNPEETGYGTILRGVATVPALVASGLAATTGAAADIFGGIAGIPRFLATPHGDPTPPKIPGITSSGVQPRLKPSADEVADSIPPGGQGSGIGEFNAAESLLRNRDLLAQKGGDTTSGIPAAVRDKDRDRWLALTEFGSRLAAGNSPYFAQNFGPAAAAGISSYRQSQSQYDDDQMKQAELDLRRRDIEGQARARADTTAATLTGIEGGVAEARIRANATQAAAVLRGSAKDAGISDRDYASLVDQATKIATAANQGVPPSKEAIYAILSDLITKRGPFGVVGAGGVAGGGSTDQGLNMDESGSYR